MILEETVKNQNSQWGNRKESSPGSKSLLRTEKTEEDECRVALVQRPHQSFPL